MTAQPQHSSIIDALGAQGALTQAGLDAASLDLRIGCLLDCPHPHAPLLIAFGFVDWEQPSAFDFWGRSK